MMKSIFGKQMPLLQRANYVDIEHSYALLTSLHHTLLNRNVVVVFTCLFRSMNSTEKITLKISKFFSKVRNRLDIKGDDRQ